VLVKGKVEVRSEIAYKLEVGIGFRSTKAVVQVGNVENESELSRAGAQRAQKCHGVGPARYPDAKAQAGLEVIRAEREAELAGHYQNDRRRAWRFPG